LRKRGVGGSGIERVAEPRVLVREVRWSQWMRLEEVWME
jgi:hypothetical protein